MNSSISDGPTTDVSDFDRLLADFDHHSPAVAADPGAFFAQLHPSCRVLSGTHYGGSHAFIKHATVSGMARESSIYSSAHNLDGGSGTGILIPPAPVRLSFLEMDPPGHGPLRKVVAQWFSPSAIRNYADRMTELIRQRIELVRDLETFDAVDDLANPLTALLTLDFIGLPIEDWRIYLKPIHAQAFVTPDSPEFAELLADMAVARRRMAETVAERRAHPRDDLLSKLLTVEVAGVPITDDVAADAMWMVLGGGFDTTSGAMANVIKYLSEHTDARSELTARPELIATAVDEFVRFFAPSTFSARTVTEPTTVEGVDLPAGAHVLLGWAAANRDPEQFDAPNQLRLDRSPNRHLSYGFGIHRCLGANFAQLELELFLTELLRHIPDFRVLDGVEPFPSAGVVNGFIHLPTAVR